MNSRKLIWAGLLSMLCMGLPAWAQEGTASSSGTSVIGSPPVTDAPGYQFQRIGIAPIRNESRLREAGEAMTEMLAGRLGSRFPDAEFIMLDLSELTLPDGPLLLEEAMEVGRHFGVDALIDGTFFSVEIVGGTWPNRGSDFPQACGAFSWRLVECQAGMLVTDEEINPDKPSTYPQRIRSSEELVTRVMQDLVWSVGDRLEEQALIAGTDQKAVKQGEPN